MACLGEDASEADNVCYDDDDALRLLNKSAAIDNHVIRKICYLCQVNYAHTATNDESES
jgi:hypothetical protein